MGADQKESCPVGTDGEKKILGVVFVVARLSFRI